MVTWDVPLVSRRTRDVVLERTERCSSRSSAAWCEDASKRHLLLAGRRSRDGNAHGIVLGTALGSAWRGGTYAILHRLGEHGLQAVDNALCVS
jgi:hypothetical protein